MCFMRALHGLRFGLPEPPALGLFYFANILLAGLRLALPLYFAA